MAGDLAIPRELVYDARFGHSFFMMLGSDWQIRTMQGRGIWQSPASLSMMLGKAGDLAIPRELVYDAEPCRGGGFGNPPRACLRYASHLIHLFKTTMKSLAGDTEVFGRTAFVVAELLHGFADDQGCQFFKIKLSLREFCRVHIR